MVGAVAFLMLFFIRISGLYDTDQSYNNTDNCNYDTDNTYDKSNHAYVPFALFSIGITS